MAVEHFQKSLVGYSDQQLSSANVLGTNNTFKQQKQEMFFVCVMIVTLHWKLPGMLF